jgi:hypothetical protein
VKLDKREQKNLEAAFFRLKERVAELEPLEVQQNFLTEAAFVNGVLNTISCLFQKNKPGLKTNFYFEKTPKHKRIRDFSVENQFAAYPQIQTIGQIESKIKVWLQEKIQILLPEFFVFQDPNNKMPVGTNQEKYVLEALWYPMNTIPFTIGNCLRYLAKTITAEEKIWAVYQTKDEYSDTLIFDFQHDDTHLQCTLQARTEYDQE